jgi:Tol biopolymer transport system component
MRRAVLSSAMVALGVLLACGVALAAAGDTIRVSVSSSGVQGNGFSSGPSVSAGGRFVAFTSTSTNLVPDDTNESADVFVRDRKTHTVERVAVGRRGGSQASISADGRFVAFQSRSGDRNFFDDIFVHNRQTGITRLVSIENSNDSEELGVSTDPSISADGRFVAFSSNADNLVPHDTNPWHDVFVHNRQTRTTRLVSINSSGDQDWGENFGASISADGRFVAFLSEVHDFNGRYDVYVRDRQAHTTRRVSLGMSGKQTNGDSGVPSISADGRFVAFSTEATNLMPHDTNGEPDVLVRDRQRHTTRPVSVDSSGNRANGISGGPSVSADGRFVAFDSNASDLVPHDTNNTDDVFVHKF